MIVVRTTLVDESGTVLSETVETHSGTYHWEVIRWFEMMGRAIADKTDPDHKDD